MMFYWISSTAAPSVGQQDMYRSPMILLITPFEAQIMWHTKAVSVMEKNPITICFKLTFKRKFMPFLFNIYNILL